MRFDTYCRPIWSLARRKPVYVVTWSGQNLIERINALMGNGPYSPGPNHPHVTLGADGERSLFVPTNRRIQPGAIINPTRELKRYLEAIR
jgi:hypothetical protein